MYINTTQLNQLNTLEWLMDDPVEVRREIILGKNGYCLTGPVSGVYKIQYDFLRKVSACSESGVLIGPTSNAV